MTNVFLYTFVDVCQYIIVKWTTFRPHDLLLGDATTTICHRYTPHDRLRSFTQNADILIVATGIPGLITADMVKKGAAVIDVGFNEVQHTESGKWRVIGDVDFNGNPYTVITLHHHHHHHYNRHYCNTVLVCLLHCNFRCSGTVIDGEVKTSLSM